MARTAALIVAAGRGTRASREGRGPKQYELIGGVPVIARTLQVFGSHPGIDHLQVVIHSDDSPPDRAPCAGRHPRPS